MMKRSSTHAIELFSSGADVIGESPVWSVTEQALYWIDIARKKIYRRSSLDALPRAWTLPDYPGCIAELLPGTAIAIAMGDGIQRLELGSGALDTLSGAPARRIGTRFNDGKVDPRGRLWVGTMQNNLGPSGETIPIKRFDGALYRFGPHDDAAILEEDIGIPNSIAWSPEGKRFYFGDSFRGQIHVYEFDVELGSIYNKRPFFCTQHLGVPDGSAIDADGCLWNARWDGSCILRITPDGKLDRVIEVPVLRPTCCAFGGPNLKTLFVTSAIDELSAEQREVYPLSGSVLAIDGLGQGVPSLPMRCQHQS
jgi:L-arabinonolactonase